VTTLRVATVNLLHGMTLIPGQGPQPGAVDVDALRAAARQIDADVVALQEVDVDQPRSGSVDQVALVADELGAVDHVFAATVAGTPGEIWSGLTAADRTAATGPRYGIGLASRLPLSDVEILDLGAAPVKLPLPRPDGKFMSVSDEPRAAIIATAATASGPVTVATTHLSFVPGWNFAQLRRLAIALRRREGPVLLLGDLNMFLAGTRFARGYTALARVPTYPSTRPRLQFDHVLARGLDPRAVTSVSVVRLPVSDHAMLRVALELP
jgi:endonuclease/exonuclease/phosphatase family metal-dependent hydrolase